MYTVTIIWKCTWISMVTQHDTGDGAVDFASGAAEPNAAVVILISKGTKGLLWWVGNNAITDNDRAN